MKTTTTTRARQAQAEAAAQSAETTPVVARTSTGFSDFGMPAKILIGSSIAAVAGAAAFGAMKGTTALLATEGVAVGVGEGVLVSALSGASLLSGAAVAAPFVAAAAAAGAVVYGSMKLIDRLSVTKTITEEPVAHTEEVSLSAEPVAA